MAKPVWSHIDNWSLRQLSFLLCPRTHFWGRPEGWNINRGSTLGCGILSCSQTPCNVSTVHHEEQATLRRNNSTTIDYWNLSRIFLALEPTYYPHCYPTPTCLWFVSSSGSLTRNCPFRRLAFTYSCSSPSRASASYALFAHPMALGCSFLALSISTAICRQTCQKTLPLTVSTFSTTHVHKLVFALKNVARRSATVEMSYECRHSFSARYCPHIIGLSIYFLIVYRFVEPWQRYCKMTLAQLLFQSILQEPYMIAVGFNENYSSLSSMIDRWSKDGKQFSVLMKHSWRVTYRDILLLWRDFNFFRSMEDYNDCRAVVFGTISRIRVWIDGPIGTRPILRTKIMYLPSVGLLLTEDRFASIVRAWTWMTNILGGVLRTIYVGCAFSVEIFVD